MHNHRPLNFWVVAKPAPDMPGWWIAHCLDIDVITQGDSLEDALSSIPEAVGMTLADDLKAGRDPLQRRAPPEYWAELAEIQRSGDPFIVSRDSLQFQSQSMDAMAVQVRVTMAAAPVVREVPWMWAQPHHLAA